jgi:cytoskeletal protein CcmA (bactofilin family)
VCSSDLGALIIGETAVIKGRLEVDVLILNGKLEGEVNAKVRLEIHSTGKLYGTISTPALVVQEGGFFDGNCRMAMKSDHEGNLESAGILLEKSTEMLGDQ